MAFHEVGVSARQSNVAAGPHFLQYLKACQGLGQIETLLEHYGDNVIPHFSIADMELVGTPLEVRQLRFLWRAEAVEGGAADKGEHR
jgi:hypothetical protein